ncbi:MAG: FAD-dependent oxidoreductase [Chlorobi bacterium]|nr:FAD-dependent oxidoreductase [Chlorobiota bacterium]
MHELTLTINGKTVTANPEMSILQAALSAGIDIPTLCFDKRLESTGSCWMCIVEIKGKNRFVPACSTAVSDGMVIETENPELHDMRRQNLERLIEHHCGDCMGPCELSCPAGCNIPGFIAEIARRDHEQALRIIKETIPLPGILGRICPAPCEDACRRHGVDEPVSICALKRYAADRDRERPECFVPEIAEKTGKKVAVIGAGPAGLTAAYYLLALGHDVTIFDANTEPGGMMRYGIPRFRLPESVIESELEPFRKMGAEFRMNSVLGKEMSTENLKKEYDAVFLGLGASKAARMGIPGEEEACVTSGIAFLHEASSGNTPHPGKNVLVIGGGNTAVDAARTARRLGADRVTILYRRTREEMPANHAEIEEALAEGVLLHTLAAPVSIEAHGKTAAVTAVVMQPGEPDRSGRRRPVPVAGSEFTMVADTVISATGQKVHCPQESVPGVAMNPDGTIGVNPHTLESSVEGIFAGGDCVTGADTAIRAVEQGKRAAYRINRYLLGMPSESDIPPFNSSYGPRDQAPPALYAKGDAARRVPVPEIPPGNRTTGFTEVVTGFAETDARTEAARCLQCRCKAVENCRLRELAAHYLPDYTCSQQEHAGFGISVTPDIHLEREKCVDCGICVRTLEACGTVVVPDYRKLAMSCPTGAISLPEPGR